MGKETATEQDKVEETTGRLKNLKEVCEEFANNRGIAIRYFNPAAFFPSPYSENPDFKEFFKDMRSWYGIDIAEGMVGFNKNVSMLYLGKQVDDGRRIGTAMIKDRQRRIIVPKWCSCADILGIMVQDRKLKGILDKVFGKAESRHSACPEPKYEQFYCRDFDLMAKVLDELAER